MPVVGGWEVPGGESEGRARARFVRRWVTRGRAATQVVAIVNRNGSGCLGAVDL